MTKKLINTISDLLWNTVYGVTLECYIRLISDNAIIARRHRRICVFAPNVYPHFHSNKDYCYPVLDPFLACAINELSIGGHYQVTVLVPDNNQARLEISNGVHLVSLSNHNYCKYTIYDSLKADKYTQLMSSLHIINDTNNLIENNLLSNISNVLTSAYQDSGSSSTGSLLSSIKKILISLFGIINYKRLSLIIFKLKSIHDSLVEQYAVLHQMFVGKIKKTALEFNQFIVFIFKLSVDLWTVIEGPGLFPVWKSDIRIYDQIDADIYVVRSEDSQMAAITAKYCSVRNKKFIIISRDYYQGNLGNLNYLTQYAIKSSNAHIVETASAEAINRSIINTREFTINTIIPCSRNNLTENIGSSFLWIGTLTELIAEVEILLTIAYHFQQNTIVLQITEWNEAEYDSFLKNVRFISNIKILLSSSVDSIAKQLANSFILLHTSYKKEAYYSFVLYSLGLGVPVVALSNSPWDNVSANSPVLYSNNNVSTMIIIIKSLLDDSTVYLDNKSKISDYVDRLQSSKDLLCAFNDALSSI